MSSLPVKTSFTFVVSLHLSSFHSSHWVVGTWERTCAAAQKTFTQIHCQAINQHATGYTTPQESSQHALYCCGSPGFLFLSHRVVPESGVVLRQKGLPKVLRGLLHSPRRRRRSHHPRGRRGHIPVPLLVLLVLHLQTLVLDLVSRKSGKRCPKKNTQGTTRTKKCF